jgi:hypothetical protein
MAKKQEPYIGSEGPEDRGPIRIRIPDYIYILGQRWDVQVIPPWSDHVVGDCDAQLRLIRIRNNVSPWLQFETFIHESCHACLMAVGVEHDEQFVNSLSPILIDVFRVNKVRFF